MDSFQGIPFDQLPEPLQQQLLEQKRRHDLQHMAVETGRHNVRDIMESLNEQQLDFFRDTLRLCADPNDGILLAGWYMGVASTILDSKFGWCTYCGTKHEQVDDLLKSAQGTDSPPTEVPDAEPDDTDDQPVTSWEGLVQVAEESVANMARWRLVPLNDEIGDTRVKCKDCGLEYVSLADRMLRDPDDCHGCKQNSQWGGAEPDFDPTIREQAMRDDRRDNP